MSLQIEISYTRLRLQDRLYGFHIESGMLNFRYRKFIMPKFVRFLLQNPLNGPHSYWSHADADQNPFWNYGFSMPRRQKRQMTGWLMEDYFVPLWMPLAVASLPTAIFWYRDRQPRKGHCQSCGYNLTGNESGVCPECATPVPEQETTE